MKDATFAYIMQDLTCGCEDNIYPYLASNTLPKQRDNQTNQQSGNGSPESHEVASNISLCGMVSLISTSKWHALSKN